jgi:hypothetical protein
VQGFLSYIKTEASAALLCFASCAGKPQTIVIARAGRLWRDRFFKLRLGKRLGAQSFLGVSFHTKPSFGCRYWHHGIAASGGNCWPFLVRYAVTTLGSPIAC